MSCPEQVASASGRGETRFVLTQRWEALSAATENPLAAFQDGSDRVLQGDGTRVVVRDGAEVHVLGEHERLVTAVAVSGDGRLALSCGYDKAVTLWDLVAGRQRWSQRKHTNYVRCVAFMPGGALAVSGGHDGKVRLWDLVSGRSTRILKHTMIRRVEAVAISADGRRLFAVCGRYLAIWDLEERRLAMAREYPAWWRGVRTTEARGLYLRSVAPLPAGRLLLGSGGPEAGGFGDEGALLLVVDAQRGEEVSAIRDRPTNVVVMIGDGPLAVAAYGRRLRLLDVESGAELHAVELADDPDTPFYVQGVRSLALGPGGAWFVAGTGRGAVLRFDVIDCR